MLVLLSNVHLNSCLYHALCKCALWCLMARLVHQIIWKIHEILIRLFAFGSEIFLGLQIVALNRKDLDQTACVQSDMSLSC